MGANSLPKTVTRQHRDCDLNPGPSAPESITLTTRLPNHPAVFRPVNWNDLPTSVSNTALSMNRGFRRELKTLELASITFDDSSKYDKKLSYRRGPARCVMSVEILPVATQQRRNYLNDMS